MSVYRLTNSLSKYEGLEFDSPWLRQFLLKLSVAFNRKNGFVVDSIGVEQKYFEYPFLARLNGLNIGGDAGPGNHAVSFVLEIKFYFHGEVSIFGNIFHRTVDP